jgi:hypothetical protein
MTQKFVNPMRGAALAVALMFLAIPSAAQYSQPIRDVDNPARQPMKFTTTYTTQTAVDTTIAEVPPGKRLVVEHVQVSCSTDLVYLRLRDYQLGKSPNNEISLPGVTQAGVPFFIDHHLLLYADPGSTLDINTPAKPAAYTCSILVTGYYVNLP